MYLCGYFFLLSNGWWRGMIKILWVVINGLFVFICYIYMGGKYWWWVFVNVMGCVDGLRVLDAQTESSLPLF